MSWRVAISFAAVVAGVSGPAAADKDPYRTHAELNARLRELAASSPDRARVHELATTPEGRQVLALEIDLDAGFADATPVLLVHAAIHGGEWISTEVVLHLAELALATRDDALRGLRIHFVPVVNADGFAAGIRGTLGDDGLLYDPNRDFPVPGGGDHPSRPVADTLRAYAKRGTLAAVLDYHSAAEAFSWPWAYSRSREPKGIASLKQVVEAMARAAGYRYGQTSRIIDYPHKGTAQDYFADVHGVPAVLMELGDGAATPDRAIEELIEQERPFLLFARWLTAPAVSPAAAAPAGTSWSR